MLLLLCPQILFIILRSYICWRRLIDFRSIELDLSLAFNFSLNHPIQEITMWTVAYSSSSTFLDFHWFLVDELMFIGDEDSSSSLMIFFFQWRGGESFFFVCQPSWWLRKEPHWYLHESFISNDLGTSSCNRGCSWSFETQSAVHHWLMFVDTMMHAML